jgi:hypothetical protein
MPKLRELQMSSLLSGIMPNLEALNLTVITAKSDSATPLLGVFPDITKMSEFKGCSVIPSNLCRQSQISLEDYSDFASTLCDAGSLPVCSVKLIELIDVARAASSETFEAAYNAASAENTRRIALTVDEREVEDALAVRELERFNALSPAEQAAELAEIEQARFDALTPEEQAAELETARFDALTPEEQAAEVAETARFNALTPEEQAAEIAAALLLNQVSAGRASFAAPGILSVLLLALAIL